MRKNLPSSSSGLEARCPCAPSGRQPEGSGPLDGQCLTSMALPRRRGFERLLRRLMRLPGAPAVLVVHWWSPLEFQGSFWEVAQDELDVIASYYDVQVRP